MPMQQRVTGSAVGLRLFVTAVPALARAAPDAAPYPIRVTCDSTSDSTIRSVAAKWGRYFLHCHKPRVTVALTNAGRTPPAELGDVLIEFRTQSPQYTATTVLTLTAPGDLRIIAVATRSVVRNRFQTTDHALTFALPAAELQPLLAAPRARLKVGGVKVELKRAQLEALALLLTPPSGGP